MLHNSRRAGLRLAAAQYGFYMGTSQVRAGCELVSRLGQARRGAPPCEGRCYAMQHALDAPAIRLDGPATAY